MVPDNEAAQPQLFPNLDGEKTVGVFYFPETSLSVNDQLNDLVTTIEHCGILSSVVSKHKISASAAPKFSPVVRWLAQFEYNLRAQKEKLLALNIPDPKPTPESTPAELAASNGR